MLVLCIPVINEKEKIIKDDSSIAPHEYTTYSIEAAYTRDTIGKYVHNYTYAHKGVALR